MRQILLD